MLPRAIIPLAWRNLTENKRRLLASVAGTAFAVTLMFMENGFRQALLDSMVNVIEQLDGQVVIVSRTLYTLAIPYNFPYRRIVQARDFPDVIGTSPVYVVTRTGYWRDLRDGSLDRICVVGIPLEDDVLNIDEVRSRGGGAGRPTRRWPMHSRARQASASFATGQVSELSGPHDQDCRHLQAGNQLPVQRQPDHERSEPVPRLPRACRPDRRRKRGDRRPGAVRPGTDVIRLRAQLQDALPADVRVLTLDEFIARERDFWDKVAPIGTVFYIGVVMGFIVGCVICYQVLFSDISDRIGEFATLKAMGYSNLRLFRVVVMQGVYLAVLGYLAGLVVSWLLFRWVHEATGLPLDLSRNDPLAILGLSVVMCVLSGAYAARKLLSVDPAQLFA